jgi:hypothetical protein
MDGWMDGWMGGGWLGGRRKLTALGHGRDGDVFDVRVDVSCPERVVLEAGQLQMAGWREAERWLREMQLAKPDGSYGA